MGNSCLWRISCAVLLFFSAGSCNKFEYSPYQAFDRDSPSGVNTKQLEKLFQTPPADDTVTIALIGDSQRFYDEVEQFVTRINQLPDIDFVIIAGDISDFGLLAELEWIEDRLQHLHPPYLSVIGNHDLVGNGEATFERFFGPLNYTFTYQGYKFIFHNTNSREYTTNNIPDMGWLNTALQDSTAQYLVGVSHVPPFDGDFSNTIEPEYAAALRSHPNFVASLHGHQHRHLDTVFYKDGVRYIVGNDFGDNQFIRLKLIHGRIYKSIMYF